jgi:hypothetical protein
MISIAEKLDRLAKLYAEQDALGAYKAPSTRCSEGTKHRPNDIEAEFPVKGRRGGEHRRPRRRGQRRLWCTANPFAGPESRRSGTRAARRGTRKA